MAKLPRTYNEDWVLRAIEENTRAAGGGAGLTDTQLRATPVPVSSSLPTGAATSANQVTYLGPRTPTTSQISVTSTVVTLAAAVSTGQDISVANNGIYPIWIRVDGNSPVADTGSYPTQNGNGLGVIILPGGLWESPLAIKTAVKGIVLSTASLATVDRYPI